MKISLVTGGAGFIGSHLVERLLKNKRRVICVDNLITGSKKNIKDVLANDKYKFIEADVSLPTHKYLKGIKVDEIYHLASPASPRGYQDAPIETYQVNSFGTHYLLKLAVKQKAKFLFASTSEVYGDPLEHPQKESYWGNVNIRGQRSCYDVSKRFGEMALTVYGRLHDLDTRTVRIFNTYGPRMDPEDGRVIPNFITQALKNKPLTVYGDGNQTRSFCYVSDMVEAIIKVMNSKKAKGDVYNLGNPKEMTMLELAQIIKKLTGSQSKIMFTDLPEDDPSRRKPDIAKIKNGLGWEPKVTLQEGLQPTLEYLKKITSSGKIDT